MEQVVPWARLQAVIEPKYPTGGRVGRQPIGVARMLRMYFLQQWFGLADEAVEDAIYDSQSMREFVGIDLGREAVPDATTLLKFRRLLEEHALTAQLPGEETQAFLDAGYTGVAKREEVVQAQAEGKIRSDIEWNVAKRRSTITKMAEGTLKELTQALERVKAQVRARVEHPFHVVKNLFQHKKTRYKGLAKNKAQLYSLFGLANLVLAKKRLMALQAEGIGAP